VSAPFIVWLAIGLVTTVAIIGFAIALVRHGILLVRTVSRFQQEIRPISNDIAAQSKQAASRASRRTFVRPGSRLEQ
jgi:hypothetical protein